MFLGFVLLYYAKQVMHLQKWNIWTVIFICCLSSSKLLIFYTHVGNRYFCLLCSTQFLASQMFHRINLIWSNHGCIISMSLYVLYYSISEMGWRDFFFWGRGRKWKFLQHKKSIKIRTVWIYSSKKIRRAIKDIWNKLTNWINKIRLCHWPFWHIWHTCRHTHVWVCISYISIKKVKVFYMNTQYLFFSYK